MYCNTLVCIAEKRAEIVLQEGQVYCNTVKCRGFKTVLQYSLMGSKCIAIGRSAWARRLAKAVHSVHSACFWPGLTRYCS